MTRPSERKSYISEPLVASAPADATAFARLSARRLLTLAGIGMILAGMIFGDIFAVFVLHQNAARVGNSLAAAATRVRNINGSVRGHPHVTVNELAASAGSW